MITRMLPSVFLTASLLASISMACSSAPTNGEEPAPATVPSGIAPAHPDRPLPGDVVVVGSTEKPAPSLHHPVGDEVPAALAEAADGARAFAPSEPVSGISASAWTGRYYDWLSHHTKSTITGNACEAGATTGMFFLAGAFEGSTATHHCVVPQPTPIYVPISVHIVSTCPENDGCSTPKTKEELDAALAKTEKAPAVVIVEVDGARLPEGSIAEVKTDDFVLDGLAGPSAAGDGGAVLACTGSIGKNDCGIAEGPRASAAGGRAVILRPLAAGEHTVHVVAQYELGHGDALETVETTYHLDVK